VDPLITFFLGVAAGLSFAILVIAYAALEFLESMEQP